MLNSSVLVLNRSYLPIHVTSGRRAFSLIYQGFACVVNDRYETFNFDSWRRVKGEIDGDFIGTPSGNICVPRVIVLSTYDRVHNSTAAFTINAPMLIGIKNDHPTRMSWS